MPYKINRKTKFTERVIVSIENVRRYLQAFGKEREIREFSVSSATVALAAQALHCEEGKIAKTLSFHNEDGGCLIIVMAGDCKIDNQKFKKYFGFKARMLSGEEVEALTGHAPGGVCPFALKDGCLVYCDESLCRFSSFFPACGSSNSAIELNCDELEKLSGCRGWIDVSRLKD